VSGLRRSVTFGGGRVMILKNELVLDDPELFIWMSMLMYISNQHFELLSKYLSQPKLC
jgi:hypothetical protein